jgi:hypothetical protein
MSNLVAALKEINRRPVGIDGIHFDAYAHPRDHGLWNPNLPGMDADLNPLKAVQESLVYGALSDPTVAFRIKNRLLERGTVENRIRERAFLRKLNVNLDRGFNDCSWGFRPGRSPEMAILRVRRAVRAGAHWAGKTDFKHFFRYVDRSILEFQLRNTIPDQALCDALLNTAAPVVVVNGRSMCRIAGLPEGNGVSPFLANLYLDGFDTACSRFCSFRYADDLLVLGHTREEVQEALELIRALAAILRLKLNAKKTAILDLYREPGVFLGYELRGGNVWPPQKAIEQFEKKLLSRGQEDREQLMKGFVRRFSIGPVRKLFRRLDRRFAELFPPGVSLVGLLDALRADSVVYSTMEEATSV